MCPKISFAPYWSAGCERFRQPSSLVSHWLEGRANCMPTQGTMTNLAPTSFCKTKTKAIDIASQSVFALTGRARFISMENLRST
jgi:hypothetical protein